MFISTTVAMIFTDGVITNRVLGHQAYSAISLFPTSLIYSV